jgi:hypothetical protein
MDIGLRALRRVTESEMLERFGARKHAERALFRTTKGGLRSASAAGRKFRSAKAARRPARQQPVTSASASFDVEPDGEQTLVQ